MVGAAAFGRKAWFENGDAFSAYFGLFARMAAFGARAESRRARTAQRARQGSERAGTIALVAVVLVSVAFDGLSRTNFWERPDAHGHRRGVIAINMLGLLGCIFAASTYLCAVALAQRLAGTRTDLRTAFLGSLVPIAFAYLVAHYFSSSCCRASTCSPWRPTRSTTDVGLFGTKDYVPDLTILEPATIWYVQVGALVVGHVLGLVIAHDMALSPLVGSLRAPRPVRHAGADGGVHGRRDVDPVPPVSGLLAHGGWGAWPWRWPVRLRSWRSVWPSGRKPTRPVHEDRRLSF